MKKDASTLVFPGGETRCIYSYSTPFSFQVSIILQLSPPSITTTTCLQVIPGDSDKVVLYFQAGGACWDKISNKMNLCLSNVEPQSLQGVFSRDASINSYATHTIIHISYCSGDVFGSDKSIYLCYLAILNGICFFVRRKRHSELQRQQRAAHRAARTHQCSIRGTQLQRHARELGPITFSCSLTLGGLVGGAAVCRSAVCEPLAAHGHGQLRRVARHAAMGQQSAPNSQAQEGAGGARQLLRPVPAWHCGIDANYPCLCIKRTILSMYVCMYVCIYVCRVL